MKRRVLVTSALPYANGPIHLGHLVEYIQTDIWVRYLRLKNAEAYYFCADDTHGTPVMLAATREGVTPDELVERVQREHYRDLSGFGVEFDLYYTTNSPENRELASAIYLKAKAAGHIARRNVSQLYCENNQKHKPMFLPDRFVKGVCPNCGALDQYGDSCEVCGATYSPHDLKDPHCALCGSVPTLRDSEHLFFKLGDFQKFLKDWISAPGRVDPGVLKKMSEWLDGELRDWDISRDGPYFGFEIPEESNKFFYVWLDAPIGYMAASRNYFVGKNRAADWDAFWKRDDETEVYHFIGKDIVYFHTLFWPAVLHAGGYRAPSAVFVHGFLTLNGEKMSKSRGTLLRAETYLRFLNPEALRYYYAARLGGALDDIDLSATDFIQKWNADVVGNLANIFSRLASGIAKKLDFTLAAGLSPEGEALFAASAAAVKEIDAAYESRSYARVVREINQVGAAINRFVNDAAPWNQIKTDPEAARQTLTDALQATRPLIVALKPILPQFAAGLETLLAAPPLDFQNFADRFAPLHRINAYEHLVKRIEESDFNAMLEEEKKISAAAAAPALATPQPAKPQPAPAQTPGLITIDDLARVDLRVGKILEAELIEGADRLLALRVDLGEERPRSVIAGIRAAYQPADLIGLSVAAVANLEPRKMKFGVSEAMLLAAGEGESLSLFTPHRSAKPGDRLR